jgi:hypothetical protein
MQWELWRAMIQATLCSSNQLKLTTALGQWKTPTHQHWPMRLSTGNHPVYAFTQKPTDPPIHLAATTSRSQKHPHLVATDERPTAHTPLILIASYQRRSETFIITSTSPAPAQSLTYPTTPSETKWNVFGSPQSPPKHDYILSLLRQRKYQQPILQKISTRFNLPLDNIPFEWPALSKYISSQPLSARAAFAKFQQGWLPTSAHLHRFNPPEQSPICPLCQKEPETQQHLYCCSDNRAQSVRLTALATFRHQLHKDRMAPSIQGVICAGLLHITGTNPQPNALAHVPSVRNYIDIQNTIGWFPLLIGYIPTALFDSHTHDVKVSRQTWVSRLIKALYGFHLEIWSHRNSLIHDPSIEQLDTVHLRLHQAVLDWYDRSDELTLAGRSLLPDNPATLQDYTAFALSELLQQLENFHLLWSRQPPITQDIRRFFQPATATSS